jgi:GT2 family glycosyltransferase
MPANHVAPVFAAVLVNYNAGRELMQALESIANQAGDASWEGIVVDNASSDGSGDAVETFAPHVRLIRNTTNVGFGTAINQGVAATTAASILVMNPDCYLEQGALLALQETLGRHSDCAIVGPRILNPDGTVQGSARGDPDMLTGLFGRSSRLRRVLPHLAVSRRNVPLGDTHLAAKRRSPGIAAVDQAPPPKTMADLRAAESRPPSADSVPVDWLSGACMLVRRAAFERVRGFDEGYFLYWEDADLCRRLRHAGYHVRYVPGSTAVHRVGHSSRTASVLATRAFHASAYRYYATHVAPGAASPKRLLAKALLAVRCWWKLRQ